MIAYPSPPPSPNPPKVYPAAKPLAYTFEEFQYLNLNLLDTATPCTTGVCTVLLNVAYPASLPSSVKKVVSVVPSVPLKMISVYYLNTCTYLSTINFNIDIAEITANHY